MSVGVETLFTCGLGLLDPWEVAKVGPDTPKRSIDFEVRCNPSRSGARTALPLRNAALTGLAARGRGCILISSNSKPGSMSMSLGWLAMAAARPRRWACRGLAQPMPSRRCLKPWRCRYAAGSRCDNPLNCCAALISPVAAHRVLHSTGARDDMGSAHTVGIDEASLRREQHQVVSAACWTTDPKP